MPPAPGGLPSLMHPPVANAEWELITSPRFDCWSTAYSPLVQRFRDRYSVVVKVHINVMELTMSKLLIATLFLSAATIASSAQTTSPPPAASDPSGVSAATHCRDTNGQVKLKSAAAPSSTTGSATSSVPSSSPGTSSSTTSSSGMTGSTQAAANLPPC